MIWYIINPHTICDSLPLPIFNNYILLIFILFIRGIVVVWPKIISILINVWFIITVTLISTLVLFIHICSSSNGMSMDTCNDGHTRSFILLVFIMYIILLVFYLLSTHLDDETHNFLSLLISFDQNNSSFYFASCKCLFGKPCC